MKRTLINRLFLTMALANPLVSAAGNSAPKGSRPIKASNPLQEDGSNGNVGEEGQKKPYSESQYKQAVSLIKAGKLKEAFGILKVMAKDEGERSRAQLLIGTLYFKKKNFKRAKYYFDAAGDAVELTRETAYSYGATYLEYEDLSRALKGYRAALRLKSGKSSQVRYELGITYFKLGLISRAERYFEEVNPRRLTDAQRIQRQEYLLEIRNRHDEFMANFQNQGNEVKELSASPSAFESSDDERDDWSVAVEKEWKIRWKPSAMLRQESNQNLNRGNGRDSSEVLAHRVGLQAYAGGSSSRQAFGGLKFDVGFTGFELKTENSRSFEIPEATGEFLSLEREHMSEENLYLNFQPSINLQLTSELRAEVGAEVATFLPHSKIGKGWGQSELYARVRGDKEGLDGGLEFAVQQPFDSNSHKTSVDLLAKGDVNKRLGEMGLRFHAQHLTMSSKNFKEFSRERMTLVDSRFRYHVGFDSETRAGFTGSLNLGDVGFRASYEFMSRTSEIAPDRLNVADDPETIAHSGNKRMFSAAMPLFDTIGLSAGFGSQNLSGYRFRLRDGVTKEVVKEYASDIDQTFFQLGCVVSLVDWVKVMLTFSEGKNEYKNTAAKDASFEGRNPRRFENSVMHVELSKSF